MKNHLLAGISAPFLLAFAAPAQAELVRSTNPQAIVQIIKSQGLPAEFNTPKGENPFIESTYNSLKFLVFFMNCDDDKANCKTIQFYMGYSDAKDTTLDELNTWNKDRRFARAYRDGEGDPVLEMDLDLDFNGIPRENVVEAIGTWKALMDAFQKHIFD